MSETNDFMNMPKDEFVQRFTAELLRIVGPTYGDEDGAPYSTDEYGGEVGPTYWDDPDQRADGPEECARTDYSYWED